jgi:hypothetical protein
MTIAQQTVDSAKVTGGARRRFFICSMLLLLASASCGSSGGSSSSGKVPLDGPCSTAKECDAPAAECIEYDGVDRCVVTDCSSDAECGSTGHCLEEECWHPCTSVSDCAEPAWECRVLKLSNGPTTGTYCIPPCRLTACSFSRFTYTCASGSYSSSEHFDYRQGTSNPVATVTVTYSNGHIVNCSGTSSQGDCSDDSGASCAW